MYIAMGFDLDEDTYGTTKLHLDVTDAVNMMVWSPDRSDVAAIWHIFPASSADSIRSLLRKTYPNLGSRDPIHSQCCYLSENLLARLASDGVRVWTIKQRVGDVVFIPAGCPHQVSCVCILLSLHSISFVICPRFAMFKVPLKWPATLSPCRTSIEPSSFCQSNEHIE